MDDREHAIRRRAYAIWEEEGRPDGRAADHWHRAGNEVEQEVDGTGAMQPTVGPRGADEPVPLPDIGRASSLQPGGPASGDLQPVDEPANPPGLVPDEDIGVPEKKDPLSGDLQPTEGPADQDGPVRDAGVGRTSALEPGGAAPGKRSGAGKRAAGTGDGAAGTRRRTKRSTAPGSG